MSTKMAQKKKVIVRQGTIIGRDYAARVEALCYPPLTEIEIQSIENVLGFCTTIHTNAIITRQAAEIRRKYGVKTMDALIAATALFTNSTLITRNVRDFKRIQELSLEAI